MELKQKTAPGRYMCIQLNELALCSVSVVFSRNPANSEDWLVTTSANHLIKKVPGCDVTNLDSPLVRRKSLEVIGVGCLQGQA